MNESDISYAVPDGRQMNDARSIKITDGERTYVFAVSMLSGDLSDSVAVVDTAARKATFMAPKGTWTVTVCRDTAGETTIGNATTITVQ